MRAQKLLQWASNFKEFFACLFVLMISNMLSIAGFGRIAAFWSGQWHHTYSVLQNHRNETKPPAEARECGPRDYDTLEFLAIDNVGNDGPGV